MSQLIFKELLAKIKNREEVALATIIEAPIQELKGQKILLDSEGEKLSTLTSDLLNPEQVKQLLGPIEEALVARELKNYSLSLAQLEGKVELLVEPFFAEPRLVIMGGGHIGQALHDLGAQLGFELIIIDDRLEFANQKRFPEAKEVIWADFEQTLLEFDFGSGDYLVIVTRGHQHDYTCLEKVIEDEVDYLGMIGSRRKVAAIFNKLEAEGYSKSDLKKVKAPIGLEIGAQTPEEIAISILAQIIKVRRGG